MPSRPARAANKRGPPTQADSTPAGKRHCSTPHQDRGTDDNPALVALLSSDIDEDVEMDRKSQSGGEERQVEGGDLSNSEANESKLHNDAFLDVLSSDAMEETADNDQRETSLPNLQDQTLEQAQEQEQGDDADQQNAHRREEFYEIVRKLHALGPLDFEDANMRDMTHAIWLMCGVVLRLLGEKE